MTSEHQQEKSSLIGRYVAGSLVAIGCCLQVVVVALAAGRLPEDEVHTVLGGMGDIPYSGVGRGMGDAAAFVMVVDEAYVFGDGDDDNDDEAIEMVDMGDVASLDMAAVGDGVDAAAAAVVVGAVAAADDDDAAAADSEDNFYFL